MKELTTAELVDRLASPGVRLLDVRSIDAYNGWRLGGEARGGHIAGAATLPVKWTSYIDWPDIVQAKGIGGDDRLILYGYTPEQTRRVGEHFARLRFGDVAVYDRFVDEWVADRELPMDRLPRYRHLVPPQWLEEILRTGRADEFDGDGFVLCHAHYQNREDYLKGHIPGAIDIDTNALESEQTWNRRSSEELDAALRAAGISRDTTVVLYGRFSFPSYSDPFPGSSAGQLAAMRCAFLMLYAGVRDVRVLNGGLQCWQDEGYPIAGGETPRMPVDDFGAAIPQHPELAVDLPEAREILQAPDANLVCVRSWREYIGEVSGYHYIEKAGRIPGAVFADCGRDAYHMDNYRNVDHTTREYHEIERNWREAGILPDHRNAFYCGTGWRGSEAFFNAWLMGWPRAAVFDGGWYEWSSDQTNPVETGVPA